MECPECGVELVTFAVPIEYRRHVPETADVAAICPTCLRLLAAAGENPNAAFDRIGGSFPATDAAGVPMAIAVGLLDSLALHRDAVEELLEAVEAAGVDPLLVLDRLDAQGTVQPTFDISRRRHQIEQLR